MPAKSLVVPPPHLRNWERASSGISVDAGPVRIRMEAAGTRDQRIDIARLIAAAPEMLLALQRLNLRCNYDALNPCWDNRPTDRFDHHWGGGPACGECLARAAIAKAVDG